MSVDTPGLVARQLLAKDGHSILDALPSTGDQNAAIHDARKAIRRMRALLALLAEDSFDLDGEDWALRRLGKGLSRLRDAHVVVETAKQLQSVHPSPGWIAVIHALELRRTRILQESLAIDPGFERRRRVVERFLQRMQVQPWGSLRPRAVRKALGRSERRTVKAAARAKVDAAPEVVHRWRRKVRRLRMQLEAAQALGVLHRHDAGRSELARKGKALHKISDRLGWEQDLRMLRNLVRSLPYAEGKQAVMTVVDRELGLCCTRKTMILYLID